MNKITDKYLESKGFEKEEDAPYYWYILKHDKFEFLTNDSETGNEWIIGFRDITQSEDFIFPYNDIDTQEKFELVFKAFDNLPK